MLASPCPSWLNPDSNSPTAFRTSATTYTMAMPSGKPAASASAERAASPRRRCTSATQRPASGPNSGPTTMAPTIRIAESR